MKKQIYTALIGLLAATITVYILKRLDSKGITYADLLPLIVLVIYFAYQNYQEYKRQSDLYLKKIEGIENNQIVSIDNFLISKSKTENNLILVRNELFWLDKKEVTNSDENILMENMIRDFKKLPENSKNFRQKMDKYIIEFSLVDNVNYDSKILVERKIEFNKI